MLSDKTCYNKTFSSHDTTMLSTEATELFSSTVVSNILVQWIPCIILNNQNFFIISFI